MSETHLDIDGREVRISSPERVVLPALGMTKLDLVEYYLAIGDVLMPTIQDRPLLLQRFPKGVGGPNFWQKRIPDSAPDWLVTTTVSTVNGTPSTVLVGADLAHVAWAVNQGVIGLHVWPQRVPTGDMADELRFDLDPSPGVDFDMLKAAARRLHELLDEVGLASFPKTSGNRGIHVYVPVTPEQDSYAVRAAAVAVARELERRHPDTITAKWWKEERGERVFIDFNQNAPHKTVFGAWSVRPIKKGTVSAPFTWDELDTLEPDELTALTVPERVRRDGDPWAAMHDSTQTLTPLMAWHERDMAAGMMDAPWPPVYPKMPNEPPRVAPSRAKKSDD